MSLEMLREVSYISPFSRNAAPPPQALREDAGEEQRVAEQVAAPQPAGLDEEPGQPLESVVGEDARAAPEPSGGVVEDGPAGQGDPDVEPVVVLHQPALLQGHAEANEKDVGPRGVDLGHHRPVLRAPGPVVEEAVPDARDLQAGVGPPEPPRGLPGHARTGAQEEEGEPPLLGEGGEEREPVSVGDPLQKPPPEHPRRQPHARPVAEDYVGTGEEAPEPLVPVAEVEAVGVDVQHDPTPPPGEACHLRVQPLHGEPVHPPPEHPDPPPTAQARPPRAPRIEASISSNLTVHEFFRARHALARTFSSVSVSARLLKAPTKPSEPSAR